MIVWSNPTSAHWDKHVNLMVALEGTSEDNQHSVWASSGDHERCWDVSVWAETEKLTRCFLQSSWFEKSLLLFQTETEVKLEWNWSETGVKGRSGLRRCRVSSGLTLRELVTAAVSTLTTKADLWGCRYRLVDLRRSEVTVSWDSGNRQITTFHSGFEEH